MTRTFLVPVDVPDPSPLALIAADIEDALTAHGVAVHHDPAQLAQRLGLRVSEDHSIQIKQVISGSAAHAPWPAIHRAWRG